MAVATRATESSSRVVVDEYVSDGKSGFRLSSMANDLLTYLHRCVERIGAKSLGL